jgi:hypothetical protein
MGYLVESLESQETFTDKIEALDRFLELADEQELKHTGATYIKNMLNHEGQFTLNSVTRWIRIIEI